jgi:hypothetical protein
MARGLVTERIFSLVAFECFSAESKKKKEEYPFLHHGSSTIEQEFIMCFLAAVHCSIIIII